MNPFLREQALYEQMAELLRSEGWSFERIALEFSRIASIVREEAQPMSATDIESLIRGCRSCYGRDLVADGVPVPGRGSTADHVDVLIVGIMPGVTELQTGRVFSGPNSKILLQAMHEAGVGTEQCTVYATNLVCCIPMGKTPKVAQVRNCSPFLAKTIDTLTPNIIVALGTEVLSYFMGKATKVGDHEGEVMLLGSTILVPIRHPSAIHRIPDEQQKQVAMAEYKQLIAAVRRMSDRFKLLKAEGKVPTKGELGVSLFTKRTEEKDQEQQSMLEV